MKIKRPKLTLEQWDNGYIFRGESPDGNESFVCATKKPDGSTDVDQLVELLCDIVEFFHEHGNRRDEKRIFITTKQGDKYEPPRKSGQV